MAMGSTHDNTATARRRRVATTGIAFAALTALGLAACTGDDDDSAASVTQAGAAAMPEMAPCVTVRATMVMLSGPGLAAKTKKATAKATSVVASIAISPSTLGGIMADRKRSINQTGDCWPKVLPARSAGVASGTSAGRLAASASPANFT